MADSDMKLKIKNVAIDYFNREGFHGATIRNIAKEANCSLPMVNYYYNSKKELFHEIIKVDYFDLLNRQATRLKINNDVLSFYTEFVFGLNQLTEHEKKVYRLGIKVYYGFDGDDELIDIMNKWEQSIFPRHYQLVKPFLKNEEQGVYVVKALVHLIATLVEEIVVKGRFLPEEEIRKELAVALKGIG